MAGSIFRKLGLTRSEDSSSESEEEVRNEFVAPADAPSQPHEPTSSASSDRRSISVFSRRALSANTGSSRSTRFTDGTADTGNSLRSEPSKNQRLRVVDVGASSGSGNTASNSNYGASTDHTASRRSRSLDETVALLNELIAKMDALDSQTNLDTAPRVSATLARLLNDYTAVLDAGVPAYRDPTQIPDSLLSAVLRVVLGFTDVFLTDQAHRSARAHLLRALSAFARSLQLLDTNTDDIHSVPTLLMDGAARTVAQPRVFAVGSTPRPVHNEEILEEVLNRLAAFDRPIIEQEGAYMAPVLRGLSPRFAVATLCLGIPDYKQQNVEAIIALRSELKSLHVFGRRDAIVPAAVSSMHPPATQAGGFAPQQQQQPLQIRPPYRIPTDPTSPPMSISVAVANAQYLSGTLGGFLYSKTSLGGQSDSSIYAITCGHVCVDESTSTNETEQQQQPQQQQQSPPMTQQQLEYPSPVLRRLFHKALAYQRARFGDDSPQRKVLETGIAQVEQQRSHVLGDVVWGERTVVGHQMSDLAMIQCLPSIKCQNWLGDDVDLSQHDPTLLLNQLRVRSIVGKSRGLDVFKYGSTSRYTSGVISSIRVAYWANGTMQTSEFAVRSRETTAFASGGDSGAWILASTAEGLGVVGMLHSYDGELREFGLYSPISNILNRLESVTGVEWGVLGVPTASDILAEEAERSD